jgi:ubiquitin-like 1-activating enzyme E1 A
MLYLSFRDLLTFVSRMRSANILLISVKALGTEIAKNLILNGIGSLTIVDSEQVTEDDLGAQYFVREEDVGRNVSIVSKGSM